MRNDHAFLSSVIRRILHSAGFYHALILTGLFLTMLIGMIAKSLYDLVLRNEALILGWGLLLRKDVFLPVIVSPIIFGAIYAQLQSSPRGFLTFIFAFQNGFFWKTVFGGIDRPTAYPQ